VRDVRGVMCEVVSGKAQGRESWTKLGGAASRGTTPPRTTTKQRSTNFRHAQHSGKRRHVGCLPAFSSSRSQPTCTLQGAEHPLTSTPLATLPDALPTRFIVQSYRCPVKRVGHASEGFTRESGPYGALDPANENPSTLLQIATPRLMDHVPDDVLRFILLCHLQHYQKRGSYDYAWVELAQVCKRDWTSPLLRANLCRLELHFCVHIAGLSSMDSLEAALIHMPALQSLSIRHYLGFDKFTTGTAVHRLILSELQYLSLNMPGSAFPLVCNYIAAPSLKRIFFHIKPWTRLFGTLATDVTVLLNCILRHVE
jgi:hypothetical protein